MAVEDGIYVGITTFTCFSEFFTLMESDINSVGYIEEKCEMFQSPLCRYDLTFQKEIKQKCGVFSYTYNFRLRCHDLQFGHESVPNPFQM